MTLAPLLYRAAPVEHLRSVSASHARSDLDKFSNPISFDSRGASPLPAPAVSATEISRPSSTSTQASNAATVQQHQYHNQNIHTPPHSSTSVSLPGLAALASIASASSSQLRYVSRDAGREMPIVSLCSPMAAPSHVRNTSMANPLMVIDYFPIMQQQA
jgi:hypothetical protein